MWFWMIFKWFLLAAALIGIVVLIAYLVKGGGLRRRIGGLGNPTTWNWNRAKFLIPSGVGLVSLLILLVIAAFIVPGVVGVLLGSLPFWGVVMAVVLAPLVLYWWNTYAARFIVGGVIVAAILAALFFSGNQPSISVASGQPNPNVAPGSNPTPRIVDPVVVTPEIRRPVVHVPTIIESPAVHEFRKTGKLPAAYGGPDDRGILIEVPADKKLSVAINPIGECEKLPNGDLMGPQVVPELCLVQGGEVMYFMNLRPVDASLMGSDGQLVAYFNGNYRDEFHLPLQNTPSKIDKVEFRCKNGEKTFITVRWVKNPAYR